MNPQRKIVLLICTMMVIVVAIGGCGQKNNIAPEAPPKVVEEPAEPPQLDPVHLGDEGLKSPLLETLQQRVLQHETEETEHITKSLSQQIADVDTILSDAKEKNRVAIRQANRQVRIGPARQAPNVLLIIVDQMGIGDLGCYGQTLWQTPNLDQLAASGLRVANAYSGGLDVESSRAALLSGRFSGFSEPKALLLPRVLWNGGYSTALIGDLGSLAKFFESSSGWSNPASEFPEWIELNGHRALLENNSAGQRRISKGEFIANEIRSYLHDSQRRRGPFFVQFSISLSMIAARNSRDLEDYQQRIQAADEMVGRVLKEIDDAGMRERTCILLTALTGPDGSMNALIEQTKSCGDFSHSPNGLSEGNLRVPFLVCWPGSIAEGAVSEEFVSACDLLPTLTQIGWVSRPSGKGDGASLVDHWRNGKPLPVRRMIWKPASDSKRLVVREQQWKLVREDDGTTYLFDLQNDPREKWNRAAENSQVIQRMNP
jgi:arylsulfatase A-like enzyme